MLLTTNKEKEHMFSENYMVSHAFKRAFNMHEWFTYPQNYKTSLSNHSMDFFCLLAKLLSKVYWYWKDSVGPSKQEWITDSSLSVRWLKKYWNVRLSWEFMNILEDSHKLGSLVVRLEDFESEFRIPDFCSFSFDLGSHFQFNLLLERAQRYTSQRGGWGILVLGPCELG